jgi:hypothetical protein
VRALIDDELINHYIFGLDESPSMKPHARTLVQVFDGLIADLASQAKEFGQETRVTIYAFNSAGTERCIVFDRDVATIPSIAGRYGPDRGFTAAVDCTHLMLDDLSLIPAKYGDRAVALWMLTDGGDNDSSKSPDLLRQRFAQLPGNVSVGAYVPHEQARRFTVDRCGYPADAVKIWNPAGANAVEQVGREMSSTSRSFMQARAEAKRSGVQFTGRSLFGLADVQSVLVPLTTGSFTTYPVPHDADIAPYVRLRHGHYPVGKVYYQPTKTVVVQDGKDAIIRGTDGHYYAGSLEDSRALLGLPRGTARLDPSHLQTGGCAVFIKSTSHNRVLKAGTEIVVLR